MAKRFIDTDMWSKKWIRLLDPKLKLFWVYLLSRCNHAGIYEVDLELASFQLKLELDEKEILNSFNGNIKPIDKDKWFIPKFVEFQYGPLNEKVNKDGAIPMQFNNKSINKGNEIALIIKSKLDKRNIPNSKNIAKGLTGNIYAENNTFKFNREEDADVEFKGYGLFQFTDYRDKTTGNIVGHRTEYNKYLKQKNIKDSIESQIEYVLDNIYTKGKEGSGHDIGAGNKESLRLTFLGANATNIAEIFMKLYENPKSHKSLNKRIEFANKLFNNEEK